MKSLGVLLLLVTGTAFASHPEVLLYDGPFDLQVSEVRSIAPQRRVGFGHSLSVYVVQAASPRMKYELYCTGDAPESGRKYTGSEDFVSVTFSPLQSWPVDRNSVPIINMPKKGDKTLFRVVTIHKLLSGTRSDVACDVHTETPIGSYFPR